MTKKIKTYLLPVCLTTLLLCGCSQTENAETAVTEKTVQVTAEITDTAALPLNLTEEQKQIQSLLTEAKQFFFDYYKGYEIQTHADHGKFITQEAALSDGEIYENRLYEVVSGEVTTKDDLINKMKPIFTDEFSEEMLNALGGTHDYYYFDKIGRAHV